MTDRHVVHRGRVLAVVPTLGERVDTLGSALESLRHQTGVDCTIVVVAPAQAVAARAIARAHSALIVDDPRRGLSAAVNAGVAAADGEVYFAWIGDDDAMCPDGLAVLIHMLERDPGAVVAYGACEYMDENGRVFAVNRSGRLARWVQPWGPNLLPQPASLSRLDAMRSVGPYDETLELAMDLDMFLRLRRCGSFVSTRAPVARYRWHPDALTVANRAKSLGEARDIRRRYLPRWLLPVAPVWEVPVQYAMDFASWRLSARRAL